MFTITGLGDHDAAKRVIRFGEMRTRLPASCGATHHARRDSVLILALRQPPQLLRPVMLCARKTPFVTNFTPTAPAVT